MKKNKQRVRAILVDDSVQARKLLRLMLLELTQEVEVVGEAANYDDALKLLQDEKPEAVFLDIEMPGKSGLQLAEKISAEKIPVEIVFTTAFNEYALKAFRLSATDYLFKPIQEKQLAEAVAKATAEFADETQRPKAGSFDEKL